MDCTEQVTAPDGTVETHLKAGFVATQETRIVDGQPVVVTVITKC